MKPATQEKIYRSSIKILFFTENPNKQVLPVVTFFAAKSQCKRTSYSAFTLKPHNHNRQQFRTSTDIHTCIHFISEAYWFNVVSHSTYKTQCLLEGSKDPGAPSVLAAIVASILLYTVGLYYSIRVRFSQVIS